MANSKEVGKAVEQTLRDAFRTGNTAIDEMRVLQNPNKVETQPKVKKKPNEKVIENRHGSNIVLGRDYKYDELNDTSVGMIDITTGRIANSRQDGTPIISPEDENPKDLYSTGDFDLDAARIYLSQKSDIDKLFTLPAGTLGDADNRSAVGIKADAVRIISRDSSAGIKLVVEGKENSQGGDGDGLSGVELIAGGGTDMQPMVKADDLAKSLCEITQFITALETMVTTMFKNQMAFNQQVAGEMHFTFTGEGVGRTLPPGDNLAQYGKTYMDFFNYVWEGKALSTKIKLYESLDLGLSDSGEEGKKTKILNSNFASAHHKLD
tara:strand:- start:3023 stop:3988 length:966 start_codon:yes stop_codon:yes gene_type:complete